MNVFYFTHHCLLWPSTNRISDIRFCEGFAENGCKVEIFAPYVFMNGNIEEADIFSTYGIRHPFRVKLFATRFRQEVTRKGMFLLMGFIALTYLRILVRTRAQRGDTYILSRDVNCLLPILLINRMLPRRRRPRVVLWMHEIKPHRKQYAWAYRQVDGAIGTNSAILDDIHQTVGIPRERLAITLNPISTWQVQFDLSKAAARVQTSLPPEATLVVYTGKLGRNVREIQYILMAAKALPAYTFLLTGGTTLAQQFYRTFCEKQGIRNVLFTGFLRDYTDIIRYQFAADVLVSYYTSDHHMVDYNYPQKITEYMLAGRPIVTPDYRATRDVLNEENAIFVQPENLASLVAGIRRAVEDREMAEQRALKARRCAQDITFKKRAEHLMTFFRSL